VGRTGFAPTRQDHPPFLALRTRSRVTPAAPYGPGGGSTSPHPFSGRSSPRKIIDAHLLAVDVDSFEPEDTRRRTNGSVLALARHPMSATSDLTEPAGARSNPRNQRSFRSDKVLTGQRLDISVPRPTSQSSQRHADQLPLVEQRGDVGVRPNTPFDARRHCGRHLVAVGLFGEGSGADERSCNTCSAATPPPPDSRPSLRRRS
jgi:hypothetical protein